MKSKKISKRRMNPKSHSILILLSVVSFFANYSLFGQSHKPKSTTKCFKQRNISQNVKIDFWKNEMSPSTEAAGISIYFGIGFDSVTNFDIRLNNNSIDRFHCKTNYSVGYCVNDTLGVLPQTFISYDNIKVGNLIKINVPNELIIIKIPNNFKLYNRLKIFKQKGWNAVFESDSQVHILE